MESVSLEIPIMEELYEDSPISVTRKISRKQSRIKKLRHSSTNEVDTLFTPVAKNLREKFKREKHGSKVYEDNDNQFLFSSYTEMIARDMMKDGNSENESIKTVKKDFNNNKNQTKESSEKSNFRFPQNKEKKVENFRSLNEPPKEQQGNENGKISEMLKKRREYKKRRRVQGKSKSYNPPGFMLREERKSIREALRPKHEYHQRLSKIVELYHLESEETNKKNNRRNKRKKKKLSSSFQFIESMFPEIKTAKEKCFLI